MRLAKLTKLDEMVGKTVASVGPGHDINYQTIVITFTDGDTITLVGGGYEGYGDYIDVFDSP